MVLIVTASPAVAERIGISPMYFVGHQALVLGPSLMTMIVVSLLPPRQVRRLAVAVFLGSLALLALTLVLGDEIKGARRWISLAGLSLQPSEFRSEEHTSELQSLMRISYAVFCL